MASSSTLGHGFTTKSESALSLTRMRLLDISDNSTHSDLLALLSLVQVLEIDLLPLTWYPALHVGRGGFATLNEAPVNSKINLAFKRLIKLEDTAMKETASFSSSMKEITILRHDTVVRHPNVVDFHGISWEVNPIGGRIFPVLVLEKAPCGDLFCFRDTIEGKGMSVNTKLSLCSQIADGLAMLHASLIVHGDIKPQNILIFEDEDSKLVAKISDFGSSVIGQYNDDMCSLPHSDDWSPPEYHHRGISIASAMKMDVYSFALLCFWLLLDESCGASDSISALKVLRQEKACSGLRKAAHSLILSLKLSNEHMQGLHYLFEMALADEPSKRIVGFQSMPELLDPDTDLHNWVYQSSPVLDCIHHAKFKISHNLYQLTFANYLVRMLIFQCLEHKASTSKCKKCMKRAAFELSFCYYIGFGTPRDLQLAETWVRRSGKNLEDLEDEKDEVIDYDLYPNKALNELRRQHFSMIMDHTNEYRRLDYNVETVMNTLQREIRDLEESFPGQLMLAVTIKGVLAGVYLGAGRTSDAKLVYQQLVHFFETDPDHGSTHPDTWASQQHLAEILRQCGDLDEAEKLIRQCLESRVGSEVVKDPDALECKVTLGSILFDSQKFGEASHIFEESYRVAITILGPEHPQTLFLMSNLACAYRAQGLLAEAEDLDIKTLDTKRRILDDGDVAHYSTVTSAANLAFTYSAQGRWGEAEELELWVLQERTKSLGELHPATLMAKRQLAETHRQQGKNDV